MDQERSWRTWPIGWGRFGAAGAMPDQPPFSTLTRLAFVMLYVSAFGLAVALAASHWIIWTLWTAAFSALVVATVVLTILRRRLDNAAIDDATPDAHV